MTKRTRLNTLARTCGPERRVAVKEQRPKEGSVNDLRLKSAAFNLFMRRGIAEIAPIVIGDRAELTGAAALQHRKLLRLFAFRDPCLSRLFVFRTPWRCKRNAV